MSRQARRFRRNTESVEMEDGLDEEDDEEEDEDEDEDEEDEPEVESSSSSPESKEDSSCDDSRKESISMPSRRASATRTAWSRRRAKERWVEWVCEPCLCESDESSSSSACTQAGVRSGSSSMASTTYQGASSSSVVVWALGPRPLPGSKDQSSSDECEWADGRGSSRPAATAAATAMRSRASHSWRRLRCLRRRHLVVELLAT
mmetsp:Transcript_5823/g.18983  ORF Transcript_5823/g.18983 Transcript_5823/m.18983 type:complete len:204 (+) Transcript_5823:155-766(+)